jgi:SAM-dependent methyltransferase
MSAYGQNGLTVVDRFGVFLSRRPILDVIGRYRTPDVLDIGCGYEATLLRGLAPRIRTGVGIDSGVSDAAKAVPKLRFLEGTAEQMLPGLEPGTFDVVLMISVLEHLWEPLEPLRQSRRALRPGGALVVNVPNWRGKELLELATFRLKVSKTADGLDDHKTYYDKRDLWPLLVKAGFKSSEIRMKYHKFGLNLFAVAEMSAMPGHSIGAATSR